MKKAALFDLDGVIIDSETQYTEFWGSQFHLYYPDQQGLEYLIKGMTLTQIYERYFADQEEQRNCITKALDDFELDMHYDYIAGFEDYIHRLRIKGIKMAVVTSSNLGKMANVYQQHPDFRSLFDSILTSEDFERSKPDPDGYLKAAKALGIEPNECVGYEDSINGLKAVRAAGMFCVGLATTNSREVVKPLADVVIDDFTQLPDDFFEEA